MATELRELITSGEYPPGSAIPPLPELMDKYGAARDTVREAISRLTHEGLVSPRRGIGTVVRQRASVDLSYMPNQTVQTWPAQTEAEKDTVVHCTWVDSDEHIGKQLEIAKNVPVFLRTRHQTKDGMVSRLHDQWIPEQLVEAIRKKGIDLAEETEAGNIFELLKIAGYTPTIVTETFSTRMPSPEEKEILSLEEGVPVLVISRVTRDANNKPLETSYMVGAGDRITQTLTVPIKS